MKKLTGALATGLIVATALGSLIAAPAFAADATAAPMTKTDTSPATAVNMPKAVPNDAAQSATPKAAIAAPAPTAADQATAKVDRTKMPERATMSRHRVEQIQAALAKGGEPVAIDGIWGPKTIMAVKDFQKSHDLKMTGHLDRETLMALPKVG
jgi:peptidoglycan hydrolase-like protein with peptidoglycan-binding domain